MNHPISRERLKAGSSPIGVPVQESRSGSGESRICMPTFSAFAKHAYRTGLWEAQDVLVGCDGVDLIPMQATRQLSWKESLMSRLVYHDVSDMVSTFNPGLHPVRLTKQYDLFMFVCPWWRDLWYANAIEGWRDQCRTSVCWIDELWAADVPKLRHWLPLLSKFDHVIVGIQGTGSALSAAIGRPCHELPGGVDALRFSPYPTPPARVVDVWSVGRRLDAIHQTLLEFSASRQLFYVHDTVQSGNSAVPDYREHREMYARMAKRSRFFVVAPGKVNVLEQTRGQVDLGFRYFEGAAAGAVLIGQAPDCEMFRRYFDWPDVVIKVREDGADAAEVLSELWSQPERILDMSRRNAQHSLRRHDWAYRWKAVLDIAGIAAAPAMNARMERLEELARLVQADRLGAGDA